MPLSTTARRAAVAGMVAATVTLGSAGWAAAQGSDDGTSDTTNPDTTAPDARAHDGTAPHDGHTERGAPHGTGTGNCQDGESGGDQQDHRGPDRGTDSRADDGTEAEASSFSAA
jgi:hypothetical protein